MRKINNIEKKFMKFEPPSMRPNIKMLWKKAKDFYVWNERDEKCIDFTSSIFVSNIGHSNPYFIKKIKDALNSPISHSYTYYNKYRLEYVQKLIKFIGKKKLNKCYLMSSGTEATEAAFKLMRMNGQKLNKDKKGIISMNGSWHGRTLGALMMSGFKNQHNWIGYKDKNIYHIEFPYPWLLKEKSELFFKKSLEKRFGKNFNYKKKIAGFMLEAYQGWGSFFYPENYIKALIKFSKKNNILITMDEMQSGFARTGKKFGFEHYKFTPDIICCGKGMGSGMPLSGIVSSRKIIDIEGGYLQSTHSANPLSCAAGIAVIDEINKRKLVRKSELLGKYFINELNKLKKKYPQMIEYCFGKGLVSALIMRKYKTLKSKQVADFICEECYKDKILLMNTGKESIKFGPPLTINKQALKYSIGKIDKALKKLKIIYEN